MLCQCCVPVLSYVLRVVLWRVGFAYCDSAVRLLCAALCYEWLRAVLTCASDSYVLVQCAACCLSCAVAAVVDECLDALIQEQSTSGSLKLPKRKG